MVTSKSRNPQQCSRRCGCSDKRGTVLGSLWDDDNDMILGLVADDQTKKGMVKISAHVDSGAEANALRQNMMQWIPLRPSSASKSGKIFRGAGRDPIPARGERSVTGRIDEGQEPQDRQGLPSEASSPERCQDHKDWKSSPIGREPAFEPGSAGVHEDSPLAALCALSVSEEGGGRRGPKIRRRKEWAKGSSSLRN